MRTGVILDPIQPAVRQAQMSLMDSTQFALMGGRRCGETNPDGRFVITVPQNSTARVAAVLPPDTALGLETRVGAVNASYVDNNGECWCASNVDTVPHIMVVKNILESGTFTLTTFPPVMGMTVCVDLKGS